MATLPIVEKCSVQFPDKVTLRFSKDEMERGELSGLLGNDGVRKAVVEEIKQVVRKHGTGELAPLIEGKRVMRTPGAGILPILNLDGQEFAVAHIRGSNRGRLWAINYSIGDVFRWKEFAGVVDDIKAQGDPREVGRKELSEELSLVSEGGKLLLPDGMEDDDDDLKKSIDIAKDRANRYYEANPMLNAKPINSLVDNGYGLHIRTLNSGVDVTVEVPAIESGTKGKTQF